MPGEENLIPQSERTKEAQREIAKMGAAASNAKRRAKKSMQETWDVIRKMPLDDGEVDEIEAIQSVGAVKGANITVESAMILAMARKAMKGDVRAFQALQKYTESGRITEDLTRERAELELEKLRMEVDAYHRAAERVDMGVTIIDDIPNS